MRAKKMAAIGSALGLLVASMAGCVFPQLEPPENAVTFGIKAAQSRLTETTAREWQAVVEKINNRTPEVEISLDDQQAQAVVDFVQANNMNTIQDIVDAVEDYQQDPSSVEDLVIPESVLELFSGEGFNPEDFLNASEAVSGTVGETIGF